MYSDLSVSLRFEVLVNLKEAAILIVSDIEVKQILDEWKGLETCKVILASDTQIGALALHEEETASKYDGYVSFKEQNESISASCVVNGKLVQSGIEDGLVSLLSSFDRTESSLLTYLSQLEKALGLSFKSQKAGDISDSVK